MTSDCNCLFDGFSYALIMHSPVLLRCCHRLYRNRICLFFIASIWKWHQWIAGILPINLTENQTIFNEVGFQFCKQIFYVISIIVIRVISFLGPIWSRKHKEPIDAYMYSLTDMYSLPIVEKPLSSDYRERPTHPTVLLSRCERGPPGPSRPPVDSREQ